jgi:hypothetical protein
LWVPWAAIRRLAAKPAVTRYEAEVERIDKLAGIKAPTWPG